MRFVDVDLTDEYNYGAVFVSTHKTKIACIVHIYLGMTNSGKYCFMMLPSSCKDLFYLIEDNDYNGLMRIIGDEFWNDDIFFSHDVGKFKNSGDVDAVPFMNKLMAIGMINKDFIYELRDLFKEHFES